MVSVITSGHDVADARLHREVAALTDAGLSVEVLGLGDPDDGPPGAVVRTWPRVGGVRRAAVATRMAAAARGRVLLTLDPDSALAGWAVTRTAGRARAGRRRRLVVDVHEDYAAMLADRAWANGLRGALAQRLVRAFQRVAAGADLTVVADEHVPPLIARRRLVVRNEPDLRLLPGPTPADAQPRAVYVGDLRASRGLFAMVEAVRAAPQWHLDLVGPVAAADSARLADMLTDPQLAARVQLHGRRPPAQAWEHARGAWVGLLLLADTPAFRDAEPSKLAEYLACGLPVLSTDLPRQAQVVRDEDAGAVVPTGPDAMVGAWAGAVLRHWAADPVDLGAVRDRLQQRAIRAESRPTGYRRLAEAVAGLS